MTEMSEMDGLELPDFLNRKLNGIVAERAPVSRKSYTRTKKLAEGSVRVYFATPYKGVSFGWHNVVVVGEDKKSVRIMVSGKTRAISMPRAVWERVVGFSTERNLAHRPVASQPTQHEPDDAAEPTFIARSGASSPLPHLQSPHATWEIKRPPFWEPLSIRCCSCQNCISCKRRACHQLGYRA